MIAVLTCILSLGPGDSTRVDTVRVESQRTHIAHLGHMVREISMNPGRMLGQDLESAGTVFKQYGNTGISTITLRGADAAQTQVLWNGLPMTNPMLGIFDFNLVNSFGLDMLRVTEGGNSAAFGSGSVGGTVEMGQQLPTRAGSGFRLMHEAGSFGLYRAGLDLIYGAKNFAIRGTALQGTLQNNFPYRDAFNGEHTRLRNARFNSGFQRVVLGNTQGRLRSKFVLEHNDAYRQLPSYSGASGFGLQQDRNLRSMGEIALSGKNTWLGRYGIFSDRILYLAPGFGSTDTSRSINQYIQLEWQRAFKHLHASAGMDLNSATARVPYYNGAKTRFAPALYAGLRLQQRSLALGALVRYEGLENIFSGSLNGEYALSRNSSLLFNAGNSFRRPTLNDLYWGGTNPLNPERGLNAEISFKVAHPGKIRWQAWLGAYHRDILQAIRWVPGTGGLWRPVNIDHLRCEGVQFWGNAESKISKKIKLELTLNYNFTHSMLLQPDGTSMPNMFVPMHAGNAQLGLRAKQWNAGINGIFNGYRYTSTDRSHFLPGYFLMNAWLECSFKVYKKCTGLLRYDAFNMGGTQYQLMPNYPMPGSNQQIKLILRNI